VLTIFNAITATGICFYVERFGRRRLFLISTTGMMLSYMSWTIAAGRYAASGVPGPIVDGAETTVYTNHGAGQAVLGVIFIYYFFYNLAWSGLLIGYTAEILPYNIRAKGLTVVFLSVDIALFFNSYVNPIALGAIGWHYYIVYTCWLAVELVVVYFLYIETKNTPLEEMAKHFDGEDAIIGGAAATEKGMELARQAGLQDTVRSASMASNKYDSKGGMGTSHQEVLA
jgi:MFS family permease